MVDIVGAVDRMRPFNRTNALARSEALRGAQIQNDQAELNLAMTPAMFDLEASQVYMKQREDAAKLISTGVGNLARMNPQDRARWSQHMLQDPRFQRSAAILGIDTRTLTPDNVLEAFGMYGGYYDRATDTNVPSSVREYEYRSGLTPDQQAQFDATQRARQIVDIEGSPNVLQPPGQPPLDLSSPQAEVAAAANRAGAEQAAREAAITEAIPGRVQAQTGADLEVSAPSAFAAAESSLAGLQLVADKANELINHPGLAAATGFGGPTVSMISGTDARNAAALLTTLRANIFAGALKAMRDASATGGAVGQVTDAEGARFENMWGALEQSQTTEQFVQQLNAIASFTGGAMQRIQDAYERQYQGVPGAPMFQVPQSEVVMEISTEAEFEALQSGQKFRVPGMAPGTTRTKP